MTDTDLPVQTVHDGVGPMFHRVYSVEFDGTPEDALETMRLLQVDPNCVSPWVLATFEKTRGAPHKLVPGDEFEVHISAPWRAPVRVTEVDEKSFAFVTLDGHMEAGEIHFRTRPRDDGRVRFEIESRTRSKDRLVDLVYDKIPIARHAQATMWEKVCQAFARKAANLPEDAPDLPVDVLTERRDEETKQWEKI